MNKKPFFVFLIALVMMSSGCLDFFGNDDDEPELDDNSNQQNDGDAITPVGNITNIAPYVTAGVWNDDDDFMLVDETNMTAIFYIYVNWAAKDIDGTISSAGFDLDLDMVVDVPVDNDFGTIINPSPDEYYEGALSLSFESNWQYDRMFYPNGDGGFEGCAISMHYTFAFIAIDDSGDSGIILSQYVSPYLIDTDWDNETMELLGVPSSEIDWLASAECIDESDNTCDAASDCPPGTICHNGVCVVFVDLDNDGYYGFPGDDCNDQDMAINPGASDWWGQFMDGIDNDCDGYADEDSPPNGVACDDGDENTEEDAYENGQCRGMIRQNSPPTLSGAEITPNTASESTTLICTGFGASDDDGDSIEMTFVWTVNEVQVGTSNMLTGSSFDKGDVVSCTITPNDGKDYGASVTSSSITIQNSLPTVFGLSFDPEPVTNETTSVCLQYDIYDEDNDQLEILVSWSIDGNFKEELTADECFEISNYSVEVEPGDVLKVSVSVNDGEDQVTETYSVVIEEPPE